MSNKDKEYSIKKRLAPDHVKVVSIDNIPRQKVENGVNTWIKILFSVDEMPTFSIRIFEMDIDGYIERHSHPWEHEIIVLDGILEIYIEGEEYELRPGMAIYIPPNKVHSYRNIYRGKTRFLCAIPVRPTVTKS